MKPVNDEVKKCNERITKKCVKWLSILIVQITKYKMKNICEM